MILKNGKVVINNFLKEVDIKIKGSKIVAIENELKSKEEEEVINLAGKLVFPGLIDSHTHFQLKSRGTVTVDDFYYGTRSAAYGGVTTIIDYAEQTTESIIAGLKERKKEANEEAVVDYTFHLVINKDFNPEKHLNELYQLKRLGISSLKIFTTYEDLYMLDEDKLDILFKTVADSGLLITVHAEDNQIIKTQQEKYKDLDKTDISYHPDIRPGLAEQKAIEKLNKLSKKRGTSLYIVHLSSKQGYKVVKEAKKSNSNLYVETAPHYLTLTRDELEKPTGRLSLMTPPLRNEADNQMLWQGIIDNMIDVIATDHCAFSKEQKAIGNDSLDIFPGIPGVETMLPLIYTYGVDYERISLTRLVDLLAVKPAKLFGLYPQKGSLKEGTDADIVIYDPTVEWTLKDDNLHSQAGYTPYQGLAVKGKVAMTMIRGEIIVKDNKFKGKRGYGDFIKANLTT
ncbi:D-hydantoinase [Halobacteroides halobius DSM 5150]|uniref:D-hydantoinase n=1 Tax=Halobacteroides halobius (strain ATCC 35273 / DSM 5150 / MD-1) TaxID=748449 RepID=L0K7M7_HALHC|nr:dihydropyrimidinase [Halobacteroides halobius]AGB41021.1 D-hydantoinase [Halobacteroides halobius DSM 5150]